MSEHVSYIKRVSKKPIQVIQKELAKQINNSNPHVERVRVKSLENGSIKRVFVKAKDTGVLGTVGWVVNDNIKVCMLCRKTKFGLFTRRHHCRACGNLVCHQCSGNKSLIDGAEILGQQRICNECCSKQAANLAVPVPVHGSIDWGEPLSQNEKDIEDDDRTESSNEGPNQIKTVDQRTISEANERHNSKQHPALIGAVLLEDNHMTPEKRGNTPQKKVTSPESIAATTTEEEGEGVSVQVHGGATRTITLDMMTFEQDLLANRKDVRKLKSEASERPKLLLGWQITTDVNVTPESIFIIVDVRKNHFSRKTEFHLVQVSGTMEVKSEWALLKRSAGKSGIEFVPMRKVLFTENL